MIKLSKVITNLKQKLANQNNCWIVIPEGWNEKMLRAVEYILKENLCNFVLLVRSQSEIKTDLKNNKQVQYVIVNEEVTSPEKTALTELLCKLRAHKGMTMKKANELLSMTNYYGTMLVKTKKVDGYVGGIEYSTRDTIRPALQIVKTSKDAKIVGDYFLLERGEEKYIFTNCAVNINPTAEQLVDLAYASFQFAKKMGLITPKIAFLSYSTAGSGIGEEADKVREAVKLASSDPRFKKLEIASELQFDAAFNEPIRRKKAPDVTWGGAADIYVFPTLNAGNIGYKIAQQLGNFSATGPILCGLASPMNDLSRGATLTDIISTIIVTAISTERNSNEV